MGKLIVVEGCTLECSPAATAQIATPASTTVRASGKGCYRGALTVNVTNATAVSDGNGVGSAILYASATQTRIDGQRAVLEGDQVTVRVTGTSGGQPASGVVTVRIAEAGQSYVSAM